MKPDAANKIGRAKLSQMEADVYRVQQIDYLGLMGKGEMTLWVNSNLGGFDFF